MARPSIFSREYKRRMRARRRKIGIAAVVIIAVSLLMLSSGYVKEWFLKGFNTVKSSKNVAKLLLTGKDSNQAIDDKKTEEKKINDVKEENKDINNVNNIPQEKAEDEKFFEVKLQENRIVKVVYEDSPDGKKIKKVYDESNSYYNISPSGKNLVTWDSASQTMILIDTEGNSKDITKPFYKTKNTGTTIKRETQLTKKPNYIWCSTPKFINDDAIAYVTNLPLINKTTQFIWIYELSKNDHRQIYSKGGKNISLKDFTGDRLGIEIDGGAKYILSDGGIVD